jgi:hypothetical protein
VLLEGEEGGVPVAVGVEYCIVEDDKDCQDTPLTQVHLSKAQPLTCTVHTHSDCIQIGEPSHTRASCDVSAVLCLGVCVW